MQEFLRPMSTSQVLDRTFSLYRHNFLLFAGIAVLPPGLMLIGQLLMLTATKQIFNPTAPPPDPTQWLGTFTIAGLGFLVFLVLAGIGYAFASGASVCAVSRVHLGHATSISEAYRMLRPHIGNILGIVVLLGVGAGVLFGIVVALIVVPIALNGVRAGQGNFSSLGLSIVFGVILAFVAAVAFFFLSVKLALAVPACVLENLGVVESIKRSWRLTEGTFWRIVLVLILTAVMSSVLSVVLSIPYFIGIGLMVTRKDPTILMPFLMWQYFAEFLARTIAFPVSTISMALLYYDQRVRKEAFDLQLMMDAMGQPVTPPPPLSSTATPGMG